MNEMTNIYYVGTLQDLGLPFSLLYIDKEKRQLYILVRYSDNGNTRYIAASVSADEVVSYMNENIGLVKIFSTRPCWQASIKNDIMSFEDKRRVNFIPTKRMSELNMFNPELCDDDTWIEVFLNRITNNQPLETV